MRKFYLLAIMFQIAVISNITAQFSKVLEFNKNDFSWPSPLVSDGNAMYGFTEYGGLLDMGGVFKINKDGTGYEKIFEFTDSDNGPSLNDPLKIKDSIIYGAASYGGTNDNGWIYKIKIDGTGFLKLFDFNYTISGNCPKDMLISSDTVIYGITHSGGLNNQGCIFKINVNGTGFKKLHDFDNISSGTNPNCLIKGTDSLLYGTTSSGGNGNKGCLFKIKINGTGFKKIFDFNGYDFGQEPMSLCFANDSNIIYGLTNMGGENNKGCIYKIKIDGTGYYKLYDFDSIRGNRPSRLFAYNRTDSCLYGNAQYGGKNNMGCIFKMNTDGSNYTKVYEYCSIINGGHANNPIMLNNGEFYGSNILGGSSGDGCIFRINNDGTGYKRIHDFNLKTGNTWNLTYQADSMFYGASPNGGKYDRGCIFKAKKDGKDFSILYSFYTPSSDGETPNSYLTLSDSTLYGVTLKGGSVGYGTIYKIKTNGTGFTKLFNFTGVANGRSPSRRLIISDSILYGTTGEGGTNNTGCIYKIKTDGTGFVKLLDFTGASNGSYPYGSIIKSGNVLYGMTYLGGANNLGCIYKINTDGTNYTKLFDFSGTNDGGNPSGTLTILGDSLYGMADRGGLNDLGCIFRIHTNGTGYEKLLDFEGTTNGRYPTGSLTYFQNKLYGMTYMGGANNEGCLFEIDTNGSGFRKLVDFKYVETGSMPTNAEPIVLANCIYGIAPYGGKYYNGVIFRYAFTPAKQATSITFNNIQGAQADIGWTTGDGEKRAVFVKQGTGAITNPVNNTTYTASATWSNKGTQLGTSGYYCIYNGTGKNVTIKNLLHLSDYTVQVFEYNGDPGAEQYITTTSIGNPNTFTTIKLTQVITFDTIPMKKTDDMEFSLTATASSGLPVSFTSSNPSVATIVGNTLTIIGPGTSIITASQAGNADYYPAPDVKQTLIVLVNDIRTELSGILIYPNPATDYVTIRNTNGTIMNVKILDLEGCTRIEKNISEENLNIQNLAPGIYIIKIDNFYNKLIKQ